MSTEEQMKSNLPAGLDMRFTEFSDAPYLKEWLSDPKVSTWFPMDDIIEIEDAVNRWIGFARYRCSLTALVDGVPVGIATLYLQPYRKLAHQCELGIIVSEKYRNMGIGSDLMKNLTHLAQSFFNIELLHLQVYAKNPAVHLYERFGFTEFGRQEQWIKENDGTYVGRIFMEKWLKESPPSASK
jgi:RimJ/RimL family protein N-acetyltransferase